MLNKLKIGILSAVLLAPFTTLAADPDPTTDTDPDPTTDVDPEGAIQNPLANLPGGGINSVTDLVNWLINLLVGLVGLVAVIAIILAGYEMIFGSGDPEKIKSAKDRILWSVIGLIVVLLAWSIVRLILNLITNE